MSYKNTQEWANASRKAGEDMRQMEIWRERLNKEKINVRAVVPYRVAPGELAQISRGLPLKPTSYDPHNVTELADVNGDGTISDRERVNFERAMRLVSAPEKDSPARRSLYSSTEAQEYGWMLERKQHRRLASSAQKWVRAKSSCDLVTYADAYVTMAKHSPFAKAAHRA